MSSSWLPALTRRSSATGAVYVALSVVDSVLAGLPGAGARRARRVTKPMLMPLLAVSLADATSVAATSAGADRSSRSGRACRTIRSTLIGQGLSWGGDVALLFPGERAFRAGLGCFLAANLSYIRGFVAAPAPESHPQPHVPPATAGSAVVLFTTLAPAMTWAAYRRSPGLAAPVGAYAATICSMYASSLLVGGPGDRRARELISSGSALFVLSDAMLGARTFVLNRPQPALETAVMATYTAAQGLIALGVARLQHPEPEPEPDADGEPEA
jgi:uncharacterized membrane protein YhhN